MLSLPEFGRNFSAIRLVYRAAISSISIIEHGLSWRPARCLLSPVRRAAKTADVYATPPRCGRLRIDEPVAGTAGRSNRDIASDAAIAAAFKRGKWCRFGLE